MMLLPILLAVPALAPAPVATFFLAELVAMRRAVMAAWWAMGVGTMLLLLLLLLVVAVVLPDAKRPLPPLLPAVATLDDERPALWSLGMPSALALALALAVLAAACAAAPRWWPATGIVIAIVIDPVSATVVGDGR